VREFLRRAVDAVQGLEEICADAVERERHEPVERHSALAPFLAVLLCDAADSLTDLFLLGEVCGTNPMPKPQPQVSRCRGCSPCRTAAKIRSISYAPQRFFRFEWRSVLFQASQCFIGRLVKALPVPDRASAGHSPSATRVTVPRHRRLPDGVPRAPRIMIPLKDQGFTDGRLFAPTRLSSRFVECLLTVVA